MAQTDAKPAPSWKVRIHQANRTIQVSPTQTVLEAAIEQGVDYPHGCRSGRCGTCKSRLIDGKVDLLEHSRFALTDAEKAAGLILACRALPQNDLALAWLGDEEEQPHHPVRQVAARVTEVRDVTHDIRVIRLALAGDPLAFSAGQYVRLTVPGSPSRDYSMANQPGDTELEFHVRHVPEGVTSGHIHRNLKPDDAVRIVLAPAWPYWSDTCSRGRLGAGPDPVHRRDRAVDGHDAAHPPLLRGADDPRSLSTASFPRDGGPV